MTAVYQIFWILFLIFILGAASFDLYFVSKRKKEMSLKEAGFWTLAWVFLALFFATLIYFFIGPEKSQEFIAAYLLEKSLSVDNLFVFIVIFSFFDLPFMAQQKVLKWGIMGAFLMRLAFIFGGIWLLERFDFLFYVFGALLIFSGLKLFFHKDGEIDPQKNLFLRIARKIIPLTPNNGNNQFFIKNKKFGHFTPLFLALILVESSDVMFAFDSVPAVLAMTQDKFIAYTSNAFAILGLRALYFLIVGFLPKFIHLKKGVVILLVFIGFKMIVSQFYHIPTNFSLIFIITVLAGSMLLSLIKKKPAVGNIQ